MNKTDLEKVSEKLPLSECTKRLNSDWAPQTAAQMIMHPRYDARPSYYEEKLNKLEKRRLAYLRKLNMPNLRIQSFTLLLANDCRFTPDFSYVNTDGRGVFEDVKGPHMWEDSFVKNKVAARLYPEYVFLLVKEDGLGWNCLEMKP
jgi:hypothetical protein